MGFGNYELDKNPQSRYARRHTALQNGNGNAIDLRQLSCARTPGIATKLLGLFSEKSALVASRNAAIATTFPDGSVREAIERTTQREFNAHVI